MIKIQLSLSCLLMDHLESLIDRKRIANIMLNTLNTINDSQNITLYLNIITKS